MPNYPNQIISSRTDHLIPILIIIVFALVAVYLVFRIFLQFLVSHYDRKMPTVKQTTPSEHQAYLKQTQRQLQNSNQKVTLQSNQTAHLFGLKKIHSPSKLDLGNFNSIISLDTNRQLVRVGGKANLYSTIRQLNQLGYSLKVVPDMDHLTIGGLYGGIGGGATTFRHGAFYNTVHQIEVITGNGELVTANHKQNTDLFRLMPCSLGSLGYVLSFWLEIQPIPPYVYSETTHYRTFPEYLEAINQAVTAEVDFLDGTIFSRTEFVLITGTMTRHRDHNLPLYGKSLDIPYYERVRQGYRGYYEYHDYIYRWDIDGYYSLDEPGTTYHLARQKWFRQVFFHHRLMGGTRLRSIFKPLVSGFSDNQGQVKADVGDFMLPRDRATEFYRWYDAQIGLYPLYICPITFRRPSPFIQCGKDAIDFGVGYGVSQSDMDSKQLLRRCMKKTYQLRGDMLKYVSIFNSPDEFWSHYPASLKIEYDQCRKRHDPSQRFFSLAEKLSS